MEQSPKRIKIEEETAYNFWKWYIPNSQHPKRRESECIKNFFRFDSTYRLYTKLVHRKWHQRWYMIEVLKVSPFQMLTFERLRGQGAFTPKKYYNVMDEWFNS